MPSDHGTPTLHASSHPDGAQMIPGQQDCALYACSMHQTTP